jgi:diamine N-acetyltransferase
MPVNIRKADERDFPAILELIKEFSVFQKTPEKVAITLEDMTRDKNLFQCLVAESEDGKIAGFASFFFTYYSWTGKGLYLDDLYVKEAYRKHAIGKGLLFRVIDLAGKEKCKSVRWLVSEWNTPAIAFYEKIGAAVSGVDLNCNLTLVKATPGITIPS